MGWGDQSNSSETNWLDHEQNCELPAHTLSTYSKPENLISIPTKLPQDWTVTIIKFKNVFPQLKEILETNQAMLVHTIYYRSYLRCKPKGTFYYTSHNHTSWYQVAKKSRKDYCTFYVLMYRD